MDFEQILTHGSQEYEERLEHCVFLSKEIHAKIDEYKILREL